MADQHPTISLGEALSEPCRAKLEKFINAFARHQLILEEGKSIRKLLLERVLEPHRAELEGKWDLDYLSYAVCYAVYRTTGLDLLEME